MRKIIRILLSLVFVGILGIAGTSLYVGWSLTHPERVEVAIPVGAEGYQIEDVNFTSTDGSTSLSGWFLTSPGSDVTVILSHGYGQNRLQPDVPGWDIARALVENGFNVFMFDYRNSGLSGGNLTSVGQFEKFDLLGAIDYVKTRPSQNRKIGIIGFSMGASTAIMAAAEAPEVEAMVLDSPFADLYSYLEENMAVWSGLPHVPFTQTILFLIPPVTGTNPSEVSPIKAIARVNVPMLFIHGEDDTKISYQNSVALMENAELVQNNLYLVPGADHCGSYRQSPDQYIEKVTTFFREHLQ